MNEPGGAGSPGPGYAALHETIALWTDTDRAFLRVEGARAGRMLGGLLSADVASVSPETSLLSFVLDPRGRPLAIPRVLKLEDAFVLDISEAALRGLLEHLAVYLPPRFATVTRLQGALRHSVLGPRWAVVAKELGVPAGRAGAVGDAGFRLPGVPSPACVVRAPEDGSGFDVYDWCGTAGSVLATLVTDLGGAVAEPGDHEAWRIERGIPRFGRDITQENLPQETGLVERAVDFEKGCYTGQEVVARIHYRGHVNRHLRGLRWDGTEPIEPLPPGCELFREARPAARVTSSCDSPRLGRIALAYVRRDVPPGDHLSTSPEGSPDWLVVSLPFT